MLCAFVYLKNLIYRDHKEITNSFFAFFNCDIRPIHYTWRFFIDRSIPDTN